MILTPSLLQIMDDNNDDENFLCNRNTLALRLQQRRSRKVLAEQGIIPPLKSPGSYFPQVQRLERARKEDYLNHAIQVRPERDLLVQKHILEDTSVSGSIVASQKDLKKAKLVDDLNDKIAFRPGVIELVERNIFPATEEVQEALKGGQFSYKKISDYDEDSSDAFSPEQSARVTPSPSITFHMPTTSIPTSIALSDLSGSLVAKCDMSRSSSASSTQQNSSHPYLYRQSSKGSTIRVSGARKKKDKAKFKKYKYHQYVPPEQQGRSTDKILPDLDEDTPYSRLLQQQQMFLQLQIIHNQYSNQLNARMNCDPTQNISFSQQSAASAPSPPPLTQTMKIEKRRNCSPLTGSKLEEMKVTELKEELKMRGLKVTGTKEVLVERLKPYTLRHENIYLSNLSQSSDDGKTKFTAMVNGNGDVHSMSTVATSTSSNSHPNTSNTQTAFPIDPNTVFSHKLARMPVPEKHKVVLKQEKVTMPTWHSTELNPSQTAPPGVVSALNFEPNSDAMLKDKMLEKQQKQINDLQMMLELHRSELQQLHNQKQHHNKKEQATRKSSMETARLLTTQFQFPIVSHTDHRRTEYFEASNSKPQSQYQQERNPPKYEHSYEMRNNRASMEQPAAGESREISDLLELLNDSGELSNAPIVMRQRLNDHHLYRRVPERQVIHGQHGYLHNGINEYVTTRDQNQLRREARESGKTFTVDCHSNGQFDHTGQVVPHQLTKMLVDSAGDALMDTSSFPPIINQFTTANNPNIDPYTGEYSRPSARNSVDSGVIYSTPHFSPMDTNVDSSNPDMVSDLHLSTSSLDSGEPTLNTVSLSPSTPPRLKHSRHIHPPYHAQGSPRQTNHNLVKSASQELLSNSETPPSNGNLVGSELGWLDLTLGSAVGGPPSPVGPFAAMPTEEQSLQHSQHPNQYHGSQDFDLNAYTSSNGNLNYPPNPNNSIFDSQWDSSWEGILGTTFNS